MELNLGISLATASQTGIRLKSSENNTIFAGYDVTTQKNFVDRRSANPAKLDPTFGRHIHFAPLLLDSRVLERWLIIDRSSIERFAEGGKVVFTDLFFLSGEIGEVEIFALNGKAHLNRVESWKLSSIWNP